MIITQLLSSILTIQQQTTPVYATWNPNDKGTNTTLSNNNLTFNNISSTYVQSGVRSTIGKSSGKWYWEIKPLFGLTESSVSIPGADFAASAAGSGYWMYWMYDGNKFNNGDRQPYGQPYGIGDIIGVALDMDNKTVTMYKNGVSQGIMATGLTGTIYAATGTGSSELCSNISNFGATTFAYPVPSGFNAGLYK